VIIAVVLVGSRRVHDVPYTGDKRIDVVGAVLSAVGMGGVVLGILVWEGGGEAVAALIAIGVIAIAALVWWLVRRKRAGKPVLIDPGLFALPHFRLGISSQTLQQIALGGLMIALPIYLQMVLEYNAMEAGLSLAPLSLSMFAVALVAGKKAGRFRSSRIIRAGFSHSASSSSSHSCRASTPAGDWSSRCSSQGPVWACSSRSSTTTRSLRSRRNGSARRPA
jgi:hypothetical protein